MSEFTAAAALANLAGAGTGTGVRARLKDGSASSAEYGLEIL